MPLGKRLGVRERLIPIQHVTVGDFIDVFYESAGVTYAMRSYVGRVREGTETEIFAANGRVVLARYSGNVIHFPHKDARVLLIRAAPESKVGLFQ